MGKFPFTLRPIKLDEAVVHTEPISIPNDLSGKMTLSSKYASVHLAELAETFQTKDITEVLMSRGDEEVILTTNTILQLSRTAAAETTADDRKKYWALPAILGLLAGVGATLLFFQNAPLGFLLGIVLAIVLGGIIGFFWQKIYVGRLKRLVREWAKEILES
jgi:hypothetical protein